VETHRDPTRVLIGQETETDHGWAYEVTLHWSDAVATDHIVTLSWSDHDQLTGGLIPPSRTVHAALDLALARDDVFEPGGLPRRFDIATLRRRVPDFDEGVRARL
jgi:hypothetical protein